jgi:enamine deaminase RidA (YjgF/YER057c/UK114 family)
MPRRSHSFATHCACAVADPPDRSRVSSGAEWEARVGYSRAIRAGSGIFVSGTVGRNADGTVSPSAYAQAKRALEIIAESLHAVGAGLEHVVRTRIYVTDMALFDEVGRAHREAFAGVLPATSMVQVVRLVEPAYLLEIEADAVVG